MFQHPFFKGFSKTRGGGAPNAPYQPVWEYTIGLWESIWWTLADIEKNPKSITLYVILYNIYTWI